MLISEHEKGVAETNGELFIKGKKTRQQGLHNVSENSKKLQKRTYIEKIRSLKFKLLSLLLQGDLDSFERKTRSFFWRE